MNYKTAFCPKCKDLVAVFAKQEKNQRVLICQMHGIDLVREKNLIIK